MTATIEENALADLPSGSSHLTISLSDKANRSRAYGAWWDIINTSVLLFFVFAFFVWMSLLLLDLIGPRFLADRLNEVKSRQEMGLGLLGVTASAGTAILLWLLNKGIERWSTITRIHQFYRFFLKQLATIKTLPAAVRAERFAKAADAFLELSDRQFETISQCHPKVQKSYEELRLILWNIPEQNADKEIDDAYFRCWVIVLATKGKVKTSDHIPQPDERLTSGLKACGLPIVVK